MLSRKNSGVHGHQRILLAPEQKAAQHRLGIGMVEADISVDPHGKVGKGRIDAPFGGDVSARCFQHRHIAKCVGLVDVQLLHYSVQQDIGVFSGHMLAKSLEGAGVLFELAHQLLQFRRNAPIDRLVAQHAKSVKQRIHQVRGHVIV